MEWIAVVVAVLAAAAAFWQAFEARRARDDARRASAASAADAARSVSAAERLAAAVEEQAAIARAERARYPLPWRVRQMYGELWKVTLDSEEGALDVTVTFDEPEGAVEVDVTPEMEGRDMRPGESFSMSWGRSIASPAQLTAIIRWVRPGDDEQREWRVTLP